MILDVDILFPRLNSFTFSLYIRNANLIPRGTLDTVSSVSPILTSETSSLQTYFETKTVNGRYTGGRLDEHGNEKVDILP